MNHRNRQVGGAHYLDSTLQPWDVLYDWMAADGLRGMLIGSILKYLKRYPKKDGVKDLRKASHCLETLIQLESKLLEPAKVPSENNQSE